MGRAKWAGPRHREFGPAQARHGTKWAVPWHGPVSARAGLRFEARGPAWHDPFSFFFIFLFFLTYFYLFFCFWAAFVLMGRA